MYQCTQTKKNPHLDKGNVEDPMFETKAKDAKRSEAKNCLIEDRPSKGQEQECSRPKIKDTILQVVSKKRKVITQKPHIFYKILGDLKKKVIELETEVKVKFSLVIFVFHKSKK